MLCRREEGKIPIFDLGLYANRDHFLHLTTDGTDGSFTQDSIMKNRLNYFTVDAKPFDVYEHPLQAKREKTVSM